MKKRKPGRPRKIKSEDILPFEVKIERVQLVKTRNSPVLNALKSTISSLKTGDSFVYPKGYHGKIANIISKIHKQKNGPGYGTVQVNSETRRIGRIY